MQTVLQLLNRSYSKAQIKSAFTELNQNQIDAGIDILNDVMWQLDADGYNIGWSDVSDSSENVPAPDWMLGFIKAVVAKKLRAEAGMVRLPDLDEEIISGIDVIAKRKIRVPKIKYPNILPRGGSSSRWEDKYFENDAPGILTQSGYLRDENNNKIYKDTPSSGNTNG